MGHFFHGGAFVLLGLLLLLPTRKGTTVEKETERRRERPRSICFAIGFLMFAGIEFWGGMQSDPASERSVEAQNALSVTALAIIIAGAVSTAWLDRRAKRLPPRQ